MNKVIVIGGFHHNTYGLIRSLGEAGIKSYVILEPCHPKSKHPTPILAV